MNSINFTDASTPSTRFLHGTSLEGTDQGMPLESNELPPSNGYLSFWSEKQVHPLSIPSSPTRDVYQQFQHKDNTNIGKVDATFNASFQHPNQNIHKVPTDVSLLNHSFSWPPTPGRVLDSQFVSLFNGNSCASSDVSNLASSSTVSSSAPLSNPTDSLIARSQPQTESGAVSYEISSNTTSHPMGDATQQLTGILHPEANQQPSSLSDRLGDSDSFRIEPQLSSASFPESDPPFQFPSLELDVPSPSHPATTSASNSRLDSAPAETENRNITANWQIDSHPPEDSGLDDRRVVPAHDSGISSHRNEFSLEREILTNSVPPTTLSSDSTQDQSSSSSAADAIAARQRNTTGERPANILAAERRLRSRQRIAADEAAYQQVQEKGWEGVSEDIANQAKRHQRRVSHRINARKRSQRTTKSHRKHPDGSMFSKYGEQAAWENEYNILASPFSRLQNMERNRTAMAIVNQYGWDVPADHSAIVESAKKHNCQPREHQREIIIRAKKFLIAKSERNKTQNKPQSESENAPAASAPTAPLRSSPFNSALPFNARESSMARPECHEESLRDSTTLPLPYDLANIRESDPPFQFPSLDLDVASPSDPATTSSSNSRLDSAPAETENGNVAATVGIDWQTPEDSVLDNTSVVPADDSGISSHRNEFALEREILTNSVPPTTLTSDSTQDQSSSSSAADAIAATAGNTAGERTANILAAARRLRSRQKKEDDAKAYSEVERKGWSGVSEETAAQAKAHVLRMKQRAKRIQAKGASTNDPQKSPSSTMSKWGEKAAINNAYKILTGFCSRNENKQRNQLSIEIITQYGFDTPAESSTIVEAALRLGCEPPKDQNEIIIRAAHFLLKQERRKNSARYKTRPELHNAPSAAAHTAPVASAPFNSALPFDGTESSMARPQPQEESLANTTIVALPSGLPNLSNDKAGPA